MHNNFWIDIRHFIFNYVDFQINYELLLYLPKRVCELSTFYFLFIELRNFNQTCYRYPPKNFNSQSELKEWAILTCLSNILFIRYKYKKICRPKIIINIIVNVLICKMKYGLHKFLIMNY